LLRRFRRQWDGFKKYIIVTEANRKQSEIAITSKGLQEDMRRRRLNIDTGTHPDSFYVGMGTGDPSS
jgi:hypothetical protein